MLLNFIIISISCIWSRCHRWEKQFYNVWMCDVWNVMNISRRADLLHSNQYKTDMLNIPRDYMRFTDRRGLMRLRRSRHAGNNVRASPTGQGRPRQCIFRFLPVSALRQSHAIHYGPIDTWDELWGEDLCEDGSLHDPCSISEIERWFLNAAETPRGIIPCDFIKQSYFYVIRYSEDDECVVCRVRFEGDWPSGCRRCFARKASAITQPLFTEGIIVQPGLNLQVEFICGPLNDFFILLIMRGNPKMSKEH